MILNDFIILFILIPFIGFFISLFVPEKKESFLSGLAFSTIIIELIAILGFIYYWFVHGMKPLNFLEGSIFKSTGYNFFIDFYFDKITAVYLLIGSFLTSLITTYSRYYLHREKGYKRFFLTILFFIFGYNIAILSGNFETLFIGWEIIGISSFLLIAFYRERYLPVKNAFKVFSIYRIGDVGIILAMWASHHLFHQNISFIDLNEKSFVLSHLQNHTFLGSFIAICLLCAASVKSAQLPFSTWLPRAMEGPTPSSAIFYGSLSVHLGVFLMLRTFPFWENETYIRVLIVVLGIFTSIAATFMARVQSTVKSQIAYSSISQIGLIFIEIALGFENLALIHFAGNAFLRTYQLLISPSVVTYLIREQFYSFKPKEHTFEDSLPKKIENALYVLSLKEFNLEKVIDFMLWNPLKTIGNLLNFITVKRLIYLFIINYSLAISLFYFNKAYTYQFEKFLPEVFAFIGLVAVFKSFSERKNPMIAWLLIIMNHFWVVLAILFNDKLNLDEISFYLSGVIFAGFIGYLALLKLNKMEKRVLLNQYLGHVYEHPKFAFFFLIAALGVTGFPITTTFIGEDILFSHINSNQIVLAFFIASGFVVSGLAGVRIYTRLFLGPHVKTYHETPYRSS